jgi:transcriptional regulator with XRE-family HTH domain
MATMLSVLNLCNVKFRDEKILQSFGQRIKMMRVRLNITQEDLAYNSGLSLSQIARIETARINPTLCTIALIAKTLDVSISELFDY